MQHLNPKYIDWSEDVTEAERIEYQAAYDRSFYAACERLDASWCDLKQAVKDAVSDVLSRLGISARL